MGYFADGNAAATRNLLAIDFDRIDGVVQFEIPNPVKEIVCIA
jgi:hypothetical protein